jgi:hypothetical protein
LSYIKHLQSLQICISFTILLHWFYILVANTSILVSHSFVTQSPDLRELFGFDSRQGVEMEAISLLNQSSGGLSWNNMINTGYLLVDPFISLCFLHS